MKIDPKTQEEAMEIVYDILNQGDSRYNNPKDEMILSSFIVNKTIDLEEREILSINKPNKEDFWLVKGVQKDEKYVAKHLLKQQGFNDNEIYFERMFLGSRPDIFAEKENRIIVVECCSCRIDKIWEYLSKADEVWILTRGENPWDTPIFNKKMQLFIFKKGANWALFLKLKNDKLKQLKNINNLLDIL